MRNTPPRGTQSPGVWEPVARHHRLLDQSPATAVSTGCLGIIPRRQGGESLRPARLKPLLGSSRPVRSTPFSSWTMISPLIGAAVFTGLITSRVHGQFARMIRPPIKSDQRNLVRIDHRHPPMRPARERRYEIRPSAPRQKAGRQQCVDPDQSGLNWFNASLVNGQIGFVLDGTETPENPPKRQQRANEWR